MIEPAENGGRTLNGAKLMLQMRARALEAHLSRMETVLANVPKRKETLDTIDEDLTAITKSLAQIDSAIYKCRRLVEVETNMNLPHAPDDVRKKAEALLATIRSLGAEMDALQDLSAASSKQALESLNIINAMKAACFLSEARDPLAELLSDDLNARSKPVITALTKVNDALEKNPPDQKVWTTYRDDAQIPSQRVFAEYVDFLGGLALRDTGFDRGISQIAEELIRTYNTYKPKSAQQPAPMALPIRQEAVAKTLARIVRVGFPEWTVWALPFTAYEFWHAIAREDVDDPLRQELEKRKVLKPEEPIPSRFQTILGDAFATFTMGPAYPCSALYLLLNPLMAYAADPRSTRASRRSPRPDESPVRDDTRLCAMLEMLRLIGKQEETEGDEPPDVVLAQKFTETWSSAIQSAGVGAVTKQTQTDNEVAKTMVGALYTVLGKSHCEAVRISEWGKLPGLDHVLIDHPLAVGELRRVLNAIWKWRVSPSGTHDDEEIAEKVRMRILNKESGQTAAQSRHFGNVAPPRGVAAP